MSEKRTYPSDAEKGKQKKNEKKKKQQDKAEMSPCGLINQGMTCYLNAVLQTLFMTDKFRDGVLRFRNGVTGNYPEGKLLQALVDVFRRLQREQSAISPTEVTKALNIRNVHVQQDAAEYLLMILHRLPEPSEIFKGLMKTSTVCLTCGMEYGTETDFLSIPLSINAAEQCDVIDILKEYLSVHHQMRGVDQLFCVRCESKKDMEMINSITKWPDVLTLQLKRFEMSSTRSGSTYMRNECRVKFPLEFQAVAVNYELYAVINHYGSSTGGHYDALIKIQSGNWYRFNDDKVTKRQIPAGQQINDWSSSAYLLMYKTVLTEEVSSTPSEAVKETAGRPQTHTNTGKSKSSLKTHVSKHPDGASIKEQLNQPVSSTQNQSPVSSSMIFKVRLNEDFQYLNEESSPANRKLLNDIYSEREVTECISDKRKIKCRNIFKSQRIRTVLMKGDAGIGKTVAVQKIILDWTEKKSYHDIEYIFPIPFQMLNIIRETIKECSLMDLLWRCFEHIELFNPDSDKIMLIFDGLNEFKSPLDFKNTKKIADINESASVSDLLTNIIMGNLLPDAQILITSRPAAAKQIPDRFIHRVTEVQGFSDQQKEEYFTKNISDQRMRDKVLNHINSSKRISSMCYSPDYCRIIAAIPEEMFKTSREDFPKTLTQMYSKLLLALTEGIEKRNEMSIALGKLAFLLLLNGSSLLTNEDLKKHKITDESHLTRSSIIKKIEDGSRSFCFVNHRVQEFLAALYVTEVINEGISLIVNKPSGLKLTFGRETFTDISVLQEVTKNVLENQMDLFFCFLLGLTLESSQKYLRELKSSSSSTQYAVAKRRSSSSSAQCAAEHIKSMITSSSPATADRCSLLFDTLKELDEQYLIQDIKTQLESGPRLSPEQFSALMIKLLSSEERLDQSEEHQLKLQPPVKSSGQHELSSCHISDSVCTDLSSALRSNLCQLRELDLSGNQLTGSGVKQLSALLKHPQCKLEKLRLRSCCITDSGYADLISALRSNLCQLRELDLSGNQITDSGVKQLSDLLEDPQCKLEKLGLCSCHITGSGCDDLSSALISNSSHLRELDLSGNILGDSRAKHFSTLLANPWFTLEKLRLKHCCIGEITSPILISALRSNISHLRELDLSGNSLGDEGVKELAGLLKHHQCKLEKLGLSFCYISDSSFADLMSALISNPCHLRELDLSKTFIRDSELQKLSALLKHRQCKLEKLRLQSSIIGVKGCAALSSALISNPSHLRELDLSGNPLGDLALKSLSDLLKHHQCKLEKLGLNSCCITDSGCADLISALRSNLCHLRELDLSDNQITDSGVKQLSDLLEDPRCKLEKLRLALGNIKHAVLRSDKTTENISETAAVKTLECHFRRLNI